MAEAPATDAGRLTIGVPKETAPGERRVAMIPDAVPKLIAAGARVIVGLQLLGGSHRHGEHS